MSPKTTTAKPYRVAAGEGLANVWFKTGRLAVKTGHAETGGGFPSSRPMTRVGPRRPCTSTTTRTSNPFTSSTATSPSRSATSDRAHRRRLRVSTVERPARLRRSPGREGAGSPSPSAPAGLEELFVTGGIPVTVTYHPRENVLPPPEEIARLWPSMGSRSARRPPSSTRPLGALVDVKAKTGATGLEPATSGVTGRRSNQLNYAPGPAHCSLTGDERTTQTRGSPGCTSRARPRCPRRFALLWQRAGREARLRSERPSHLGAAPRAHAPLAQVHGRAPQGRVRADRGAARDDRRRRLLDEPLLLLHDLPLAACCALLTGDPILVGSAASELPPCAPRPSASGRCSTSRSR